MLRKKLRAMLSAKSNDLSYIELDYIESTGTQCIETSMLPRNNLTVFMDFQMTSTVTEGTNRHALAYYADKQRYRPVKVDAGLFKITSMGGVSVVYSTKLDTQRHSILYNDSNGNVQWDNEIKGKVYSSINPPDNIGLGVFGQTQTMPDGSHYTTSSTVSMRLYELIGYEKSTQKKIFHAIPVIRKLDGEICLYDKVSNTFFENQGTGDFKPGTLKNLPEGYTQLDYLANSGTQYINLGILPTVTQDISIRWQITSASLKKSQYLYGSRLGVNGFPYNTIGGSLSDLYFNSKIGGGSTAIIFNTISRTYDNDYFVRTRPITETNYSSSLFDEVKNQSSTLTNTLGAIPETGVKSLCLFAFNSANIHKEARVKMVRLLDKGKLKMFLLPMIDNSGKPCMYDVLNDKGYYNDGTGNFIAGNILKY